MGTFKEYINGYAFGVKSLLVGMRTSMKVFMQKKVTERYPENRHTTQGDGTLSGEQTHYSVHTGTSPRHAGDA